MSTEASLSRRGVLWFDALTGGAGRIPTGLRSLSVADAALGGEQARFIAVVPDAHNRFPRARAGEVGIDEAWALALHVRRFTAGGQSASGILSMPVKAARICGSARRFSVPVACQRLDSAYSYPRCTHSVGQ